MGQLRIVHLRNEANLRQARLSNWERWRGEGGRDRKRERGKKWRWEREKDIRVRTHTHFFEPLDPAMQFYKPTDFLSKVESQS